MTHASLFSGIGGFDLAAQWAGFTNVFHCEIDPFCQKVLNLHFPNSISYDNIKTTDFTRHRGEITVLSGGFPCQPFSVSGKRKGANERVEFSDYWRDFPTQSPVCSGDDGLSSKLDAITFPPNWTLLPFLVGVENQ